MLQCHLALRGVGLGQPVLQFHILPVELRLVAQIGSRLVDTARRNQRVRILQGDAARQRKLLAPGIGFAHRLVRLLFRQLDIDRQALEDCIVGRDLGRTG